MTGLRSRGIPEARSPWQAPTCMTARAMCAKSTQLARMGRLIGTSASMASMLSMQIVRALAPFRTVRATISSSLLMEAHTCSSRPILGLWRRGLSRELRPKGLVTKALHQSLSANELIGFKRAGGRGWKYDLNHHLGHCSLIAGGCASSPGRHLISLPGPLFSPGWNIVHPMMALGASACPMLQAESTEMGAPTVPAG